jgi:hypothetical protein
MAATITTTRARFSESVAVGAARVDREAGVIYGVKVLGEQSRNGRRYTLDAMRNSLKLYEGAKVNGDHPEPGKRDHDRSIRATVAILRNVQMRENALYGDLHFIKSHPDTAWILERAGMEPNSFGLSHNADGRTRRENGVVVVESIDAVRSVDLVDDPATVAGLFESLEPTVKTTIKKLLEAADAKGKATWQYKRLLEIGETLPDIGAMEVEAPAEADSASAIAEAFKAAIVAVLDDTNLSPEEKKAKIAQLIDAQMQVESGASEEDPAMTESIKKLTAEKDELAQRVKQIEAERDDVKLTAACRQLLESTDREANDVRLAALKRCPDDASRKSLLETWGKKSDARRPQTSQSILESAAPDKYTATDGKSLAEQLCR